MSNQPALAGLTKDLDLRTKELDAAVAKLAATKSDDPAYGETNKARWDASDAYNQAWDAWYEETEKPPAGATAEGNETKTNR